MPETLVEKATCEACGKEVRDGSTFCFNCGESVVVQTPPPPPIVKPPTGTLNGRTPSGSDTLPYFEIEPAPVLMPEGDPLPVKKSSQQKLEAPAPRPRRTRVVKKTLTPVEVEWVENPGSSIGYIIGAVVFAVIAIGLIIVAMYLR